MPLHNSRWAGVINTAMASRKISPKRNGGTGKLRMPVIKTPKSTWPNWADNDAPPSLSPPSRRMRCVRREAVSPAPDNPFAMYGQCDRPHGGRQSARITPPKGGGPPAADSVPTFRTSRSPDVPKSSSPAAPSKQAPLSDEKEGQNQYLHVRKSDRKSRSLRRRIFAETQ